jgi:glycosyltransferase involved in cell wall biosynthesis
MNVLVNAASIKTGGGLTYLTEVVRTLAGTEGHSFTVFMAPEARDRLEPHADGERIRLVPYPYASTSGAARLYFDQVVVPRIVRKDGHDVLYSATGFGTFRSPCPQVLMIPNALWFTTDSDAFSPRGSRANVRRWWSAASVRTADVVTFPTAALRDMALRSAPIQGRARVIHWGHEPPPRTDPPAAALDGMRRWREDGATVLLYVSLFAPHKDFPTAVETVARLRDRGRDVRLVATLPERNQEETPALAEAFDALLDRIDALDVRERILLTGTLPHAAALALYDEADLFFFPSLLESFGIPMVEALSAGLPVVAAGTPVNREICGEAGEYFTPGSADAAADAVERLLDGVDRRAALAAATEKQAERFTWKAHTAMLLEVLEEACLR